MLEEVIFFFFFLFSFFSPIFEGPFHVCTRFDRVEREFWGEELGEITILSGLEDVFSCCWLWIQVWKGKKSLLRKTLLTREARGS